MFNRFAKVLALIGALVVAALPAVAQQQWPTYPAQNFKNLLGNARLDFYPYTTSDVYTTSTVSSTLTGINTTATYYAARWAVWSNNSGASVTVANVTTGLPTGFANGVKLTRASANANTTQICMGQELKTADVIALQGQVMAFSAWLQAGTNFSAASSNAQLVIFAGTGTDEGLATFLSPGFTGGTTVTTSAQVISSTFARIGTTFTVPATATELIAATCWTPVGTAGSADSMTVTGLQLEQGGAVTAIEQRNATIENELFILPFVQVTTDGATTRRYNAACSTTTSGTTAQCNWILQVPMRSVPITVVGTAASFGLIIPAGTTTTCSTLAAAATSNTVYSAGLTCTFSATSASGSSNPFIGGNSGGFLGFVSEF